MSIHSDIKAQITEALRAKDALRLETLRGVASLFQNEMIASKISGDTLPDDKALALVKRSVNQRKDSIEQFEKGGRKDLADKERAELDILRSFMPDMMSRGEVEVAAKARIDAMKSAGTFDPKASGKVIGAIMKELAGRADGTDVKAAVEKLLRE